MVMGSLPVLGHPTIWMIVGLGPSVLHTCDSTTGSKKIQFSKPVYRSTAPVDQTTVFENFRYYIVKYSGVTKNPPKKCPNITVPAHAI